MRTQLILMVGLPASGKTSLAKLIGKELNYIHLWSDELKATLFDNYSEAKEYSELIYGSLDYAVEACLKSQNSVIYDSLFDRYEIRKEKTKIANKYNAETLTVYLKIDKNNAVKRAKKRKNLYTWEDSVEAVVDKFANQIEPPLDSEPHIILDGAIPLEDNLNKVVNHLV